MVFLLSIGLKTSGIIQSWMFGPGADPETGATAEDFVLGPKSDYELLGATVFLHCVASKSLTSQPKGLKFDVDESQTFGFKLHIKTVAFQKCLPAFLKCKAGLFLHQIYHVNVRSTPWDSDW